MSGRPGKFSLDSFQRGAPLHSGRPPPMPAQRRALARRGRQGRVHLEKPWIAPRSSVLEAPRGRETPGGEFFQQKGDAFMEIHELDRLGDVIAELSAHLEAATAHLLDLIREFDARGGWNTGFRSCAAWLAWLLGLD